MALLLRLPKSRTRQLVSILSRSSSTESSGTIATVTTPGELVIGGGSIKQLQPLLSRLGVTRPLIVTDRNMVKLGKVSEITSGLSSNSYHIFQDTVEDPTNVVVEEGVKILKDGKYDGMVAIGGGSPIDTAKGINLLAQGGKLRDYKVPFIVSRRAVPLIAIPTTAGTGSEVTRFTVITDTESNEKMLIAGPGCVPSAAIVDYTLTLTVPFRTTADTGIDTLTHAIEAYVSRRASPVSDGFALQTIGLVSQNLRGACTEPKNENYREKMMLAATLGGLAFSTASVALVHGMSRPIGAFFHVPHGLSNAMLLPLVTKFSASTPQSQKRYADCARAYGLKAYSDSSDEQYCQLLIKELEKLNKDLKVPNPLQYGINKEKYFQLLEIMATQAAASGSPGNNPVIPTKDEMISIYKEAYAFVPK